MSRRIKVDARTRADMLADTMTALYPDGLERQPGDGGGAGALTARLLGALSHSYRDVTWSPQTVLTAIDTLDAQGRARVERNGRYVRSLHLIPQTPARPTGDPQALEARVDALTAAVQGLVAGMTDVGTALHLLDDRTASLDVDTRRALDRLAPLADMPALLADLHAVWCSDKAGD